MIARQSESDVPIQIDDDSTPPSENITYKVDSGGSTTITDSSSDALYGKYVTSGQNASKTTIKATGSSSRPEIQIWFNGKETTGTFDQNAGGAKIYYYDSEATTLYFAPSRNCDTLVSDVAPHTLTR